MRYRGLSWLLGSSAGEMRLRPLGTTEPLTTLHLFKRLLPFLQALLPAFSMAPEFTRCTRCKPRPMVWTPRQVFVERGSEKQPALAHATTEMAVLKNICWQTNGRKPIRFRCLISPTCSRALLAALLVLSLVPESAVRARKMGKENVRFSSAFSYKESIDIFNAFLLK